MRHLSRAAQPPTRRISSLRNLDQTLARLRRIVPHHPAGPQLPPLPSSPTAGSLEPAVDTYEGLEALLTDTVEFLSRVVNDPVLLAGARTSLRTRHHHHHQLVGPSSPTPAAKFIVDQQVDNLFTLLKLKKKFVNLRN
ncbi:unnamed protein product [Dibothriocephalus latus]|uniref:Uncharacterized protein n=1 Tax=Dibothriocephalus latus TaxID=60516 RepID=A0A3P7LYL5_DIBLA|nr:unnamed protein product [Dibothriocephalus latus]